jgi:phage terminase large subunit
MEATKIQANKVYEFLRNSNKRIKSLRGGTRSGKTTNTLIYFIMTYLQTTGRVLTIARETMPALKASAMRDFFEILNNLDLYREADHNKTRNEYELNGNLIEFIGVSEADRVRGRKRNDLFLNEANETTLEAFRQLAFRTTDNIVIDYNPSDAFSWIYDDVETRDDCDLLVTTYRDNPFLEKSLVEEIERLRDADADYWNIYGLGQIGSGSTRVYTHWKDEANFPEGKGETVYGLDFGFNAPSALVEVTFYDDSLYWRERLYESKLTTADLIEKVKTIVPPKTLIVADSAEPDRIEEFIRAGFNIEPAFKNHKATIDFVKSKMLKVHSGSENLLREIKRYSWKTDKNGTLLDEVVKFDDHALDAARYASYRFNQPAFEVTERVKTMFRNL